MLKHKIGVISLLLLVGCGTLSSNIKEEYILQRNIGVKYIKLGLMNDAKLHLLKALELAPHKASIYNNLGVVYEYFNQIDEAQKSYQKAVELEPQMLVYQKNLLLFEKELIGTVTSINQEGKKTCANIKVTTDKIIIKKMVEPKLKIDKINRVAVFAFSKDKEAKEISEKTTELFKISIVEENPFYILEDYEVKELTEDETITQEDLKNPSKMVTLTKTLSIDGLFVIEVNEVKDNRYKDFELKNYYSQEKKEFVYYQQPYIKRNVQIDMSISFLEGATGNLLWNKNYKDEMSTTYLGENEEVIPLFDKQLFKDFISKAVSDFIMDIRPQEKVYERIVVMEK